MAEQPKLNREKERKVKRKKCEKSMKALLHHVSDSIGVEVAKTVVPKVWGTYG